MAAALKTSPLAPDAFPDLPRIAGVRFATCAAGVRYQNRDDVMLALCDAGAVVAGVFTKSSTRAAPVLDCQAKIGTTDRGPLAILVNAGNANAFTGRHGESAVTEICAAVAEIAETSVSRVLTSSTGVIGERLPQDKIIAHVGALHGALSPDSMAKAASAIITTDTFAKAATRQIDIGGSSVTVSGIAKGSGMIAPDMATMLVYLFTDAVMDQTSLQSMLSAHTETTFNAITVDSDTSTSDTVLCVATGASGVDATGSDAFSAALHDVMLDLAHQVVKDGEGATKFVEIVVQNAATASDAKTHARAIANSPLVKTAIAGEDPNWGRVVMAVGKSGAFADRDVLSIWFGDVLVAEKGWVSPDYQERDAAAHMTGQSIRITVDIGIGTESATVWTCDLTHGYIDINADYRS